MIENHLRIGYDDNVTQANNLQVQRLLIKVNTLYYSDIFNLSGNINYRDVPISLYTGNRSCVIMPRMI